MQKIIECVPNFSCARDVKVLEQILTAIKSVKNVSVLNVHKDDDHNRSVVTFVGEVEDVFNAAFEAVKTASKLINLNDHKGMHPRIGATDVVPFIPIKNVSMSECVKLALELGEKIGEELKIPVYLYEKAAKIKDRENLASIRNHQYEKIKKEIAKNDFFKPDFGPRKMGNAGAICVGVREFLIAYNINLKSNDLILAQEIAGKIRQSSGGLKGVKALGLYLKDRDIAQVSMNLVNFHKNSVYEVFKFVKKEADKHNVEILESELVGLIPQDGVNDLVKKILKLPNFNNENILERRIENWKEEDSINNYLQRLASKEPVPGGGSVSALCGALASALSSMVSNLTLNNKKYSLIHKKIAFNQNKIEEIMGNMREFMDKDSFAYEKFSIALKMDKTNPKRKKEMVKASVYAAEIPLQMADKIIELLKPISFLAKNGNLNAISDIGIALELMIVALKGAILNIKINMKWIENKKSNERFNKKIKEFNDVIDKEIFELIDIVEKRI